MTMTFNVSDTLNLVMKITELVNDNKSFYVSLIRDDDNKPHHWELMF